MSFAAAARPSSASVGSRARSAIKPRRRRIDRGFPVGERLAIAPAKIDRRDQPVRGPRVKRREQGFGAAEDGDRELAAIGAGIGVAADDRHADRCRTRRASHRALASRPRRPPPKRHRRWRSGGRPWRRRRRHSPSRRTSRQTRDRVATNSFMKPSMARQQKAVAVGDGGAVVADGNGGLGRQARGARRQQRYRALAASPRLARSVAASSPRATVPSITPPFLAAT